MICQYFIGEQAAIVPLTISATPFIARIIEGSLREVDPQIIEAAKSLALPESNNIESDHGGSITFDVIRYNLAVISILGEQLWRVSLVPVG